MKSIIKSNKHFIVFDLETEMIPRHLNKKNVKDEIKLQAIKNLKIKCACAYSSKRKKYYFYNEENIYKLISLLNNSSAIVGYNILGFDLPVLEKYGGNKLLRKKIN